MNNRQYGFGGGCAELGLVVSIFAACAAFAIVLAVKVYAGLALSSAALKALVAAAITFGVIVVFWLVAYAATLILFRNKE